MDLTHVGSVWWGIGALTILLMALIRYMLAYRAQRSDGRTLRRLYLPGIQGLALAMLNRPAFSLDDYYPSLWHASQTVRRRTLDGDTIIIDAPHRPLGSMLSTLDIESAVENASMLALERFVMLGVIEPVESMTGDRYRLTAKYRAVPSEDETA